MPIGPLMIDLLGPALTHEEAELLQHPLVGGVILFSRNFQSLSQLQALIYHIRHCRSAPLLIAVDQEGGRVQRFVNEFTQLPSFAKYGAYYDQSPLEALTLTAAAAWLMASELLAAGVDLSFTPCLDLHCGISQVIGDRSFHHDPEIVSKLAQAFIQGMARAGMKATGKHFPGHGSVAADSHHDLPLDGRSFDEIAAHDLIPFSNLINKGLAAIMAAHIVFPSCHALPAGFSEYWLQKVLRTQMNFAGAIFSDDISMAGAHAIGNYSERAAKALEAGCDMALICNNRPAVFEVLTSLENYSNPQAQQRLLKLCGHFQYTHTELLSNPLWHATRDLLRSLNDNS